MTYRNIPDFAPQSCKVFRLETLAGHAEDFDAVIKLIRSLLIPYCTVRHGNLSISKQDPKAGIMRTLFCSICLLLTIPAHAAAGPQPPSRPLQVGDMWTYRQTFEAPGKAITVTRPVFSIISENKDKALILGATNAELFSRSTTPAWTLRGMVSPDACIFDFTAQDTLGLKKTCGITLEPGKTWGSDESNTVARKEQRFTVLPDEEIAVPAGTFLSFKIQRDETVTEVAYPGVPEPAGGYVKVDRVLYWYSPDAKGFVKIARERRTSDGKLLFRLTEELEAFSKRAATGLNLGRPAAPAR